MILIGRWYYEWNNYYWSRKFNIWSQRKTSDAIEWWSSSISSRNKKNKWSNKRNINRFPENFCFKLTKEELKKISSRSQFTTLNKGNNNRGYNIKYLPYVLTEEGIMMLSGLLRSDVAVKVNVRIIEAFVKLRKYALNENKRLNIIETKLLEYDNNFNIIFDKLESKKQINHIFFEEEIYDAYSLLIDILKEAKKEVIIIDNYAGKQLFDILKAIKINIKVVTKI